MQSVKPELSFSVSTGLAVELKLPDEHILIHDLASVLENHRRIEEVLVRVFRTLGSGLNASFSAGIR